MLTETMIIDCVKNCTQEKVNTAFTEVVADHPEILADIEELLEKMCDPGQEP